MHLEEEITEEINGDPMLTDAERRHLLLEVQRRIDSGDWDGEDLDDGSPLEVYVRKWSPRGPGFRSGSIALQPDLDDPKPDAIAERLSLRQQGLFEDAAGIRQVCDDIQGFRAGE